MALVPGELPGSSSLRHGHRDGPSPGPFPGPSLSAALASLSALPALAHLNLSGNHMQPPAAEETEGEETKSELAAAAKPSRGGGLFGRRAKKTGAAAGGSAEGFASGLVVTHRALFCSDSKSVAAFFEGFRAPRSLS